MPKVIQNYRYSIKELRRRNPLICNKWVSGETERLKEKELKEFKKWQRQKKVTTTQ